MSTPAEIAHNAVQDGLAKLADARQSEDAYARSLINEAIGIYLKTRSADDIATELEFLAENLDDDQEYTFMRP